MRAFIGGILLFFLRPAQLGFIRWRLSTLDRKSQILVTKLLVDRRRSPYLDKRRNRVLAPIFGMPMSNTLEPKILDQLLGAVVAQCNQAIAAGTTAQSSITIRGSAGSGNADHTPVVGEFWLIATPGGAGTENQYTNVDIFQVSGSPTATSLTFGSRTVVAVRAVGDVCFVINTTTGISAFGNVPLLQRVFVGLSTAGATATVAAGSDLGALPVTPINITQTGGTFPASGNVIIVSEKGEQNIAYTGLTGSNPTVTQLTGCTGGTGTIDTGDQVFLVPTGATILGSEPTSAGAYARVSLVNNAAAFSAATGSYPATKQNAGTISFPASTAAWSSGATALVMWFLADASTLAGGNVLAYGYLTTPQTVNASGITPSFAASTLTNTLL
jgi:hypothetical protein